MNKRVVIIILSVITVVIVSLFFIFKVFNKTNLISKEKEIGGVKFTNIKLTKTNNKYTLSVKLIYKNEKANKLESFDASIKDKKGNEIDVLSGYIGGLNENEEKIIEITSDKDLSKAYEIIYTVYNE